MFVFGGCFSPGSLSHRSWEPGRFFLQGRCCPHVPAAVIRLGLRVQSCGVSVSLLVDRLQGSEETEHEITGTRQGPPSPEQEPETVSGWAQGRHAPRPCDAVVPGWGQARERGRSRGGREREKRRRRQQLPLPLVSASPHPPLAPFI